MSRQAPRLASWAKQRDLWSWCCTLLDGAEAALPRHSRRGFGPAPGLRALIGGVRPGAFPQTALRGGGRGSD